MMAAPPFEGATQERTTLWLPSVAVRPVGAEATLRVGTTAFETLEATLVPTVFVAVTVNV